MSRGDMSDSDWQRIQPLLPPEKTGKRGGQWRSHRQVIDGIRWIGRTGAPWRDLPERYGPWQTCAERLYRWQQEGVWTRILQCLQAEEDAQSNVQWEGVAVDSTTIKAHPHAAGARKPVSKPPQDADQPVKGGTKASQRNQISHSPRFPHPKTRHNRAFEKCSDVVAAD